MDAYFFDGKVFAITSALWDRVTYQAMRFMPWIQIAREPSDAETSLALDYHSHRFLVSAMAAAVRNRHFLVASTGAVTLFLRVLTVLAAGLVFLNGARVTSSVAVSVVDVFSPEGILTNPSPNQVHNTAYKLLETMVNENATAPFGYNLGINVGSMSTAFQTFTRPAGRDDVLNVTVDAFWADMECVPATIDTKFVVSEEDEETVFLNITTKSRFCEQGDTETQVLPTGGTGQGIIPRERLVYFGAQGGTWCGPGGEGMFSLGYYTVSEMGLDRGIGVHCRPRYHLGKVNVTATGDKIDMKRVDSNTVDWALTRTVDGMWAMSLPNSNRTIVTSTVAHLGSDAYVRDATNVIKVPDPIRMGLHLEGGGEGNKIPERMEELDSETLARAVGGFYRHLSPLVAHTELRKKVASTTIEGEALTTKLRLEVHSIVSHIMAAILAVAAVLAVFSAAVFLRDAAYMYPPNSPETILGMALNLINSSKLLHKLSGTGHLSMAQTTNIAYGTYRAVQKHGNIDEESSSSTFSISCSSESSEPPSPAPDIEPESGNSEGSHRPLYLQLLPRVVMLVFLAAVITALVLLLVLPLHLRVSENNLPGKGTRGIVELDFDAATYAHLLWTSLPTLFAVVIGTYFSAVDVNVRALLGISHLASTSAAASNSNININDNTRHGDGDNTATATTTGTATATATATAKQLQTRLADRTAFSALLTAIRTRAGSEAGAGAGMAAHAAVVSAGTALLAGCITIASGAIFTFALDPASSGRRVGGAKVVVNTPAVILVIVLLSLLLISSAISSFLLFSKRRRITNLPKAPGTGSILAMASLLADSNVFGELRWCHLRHHQGTEKEEREKEIEALFAGKRFRMGWFERNQRMVYTIGVEDRI